MNAFVNRFLSLDKLIGADLIKIIYWVGLGAIAVYTVIAFFDGLFSIGENFVSGMGAAIWAPISGAIGVMFWRLFCEAYIVLFGVYERLDDVRQGLSKD